MASLASGQLTEARASLEMLAPEARESVRARALEALLVLREGGVPAERLSPLVKDPALPLPIKRALAGYLVLELSKSGRADDGVVSSLYPDNLPPELMDSGARQKLLLLLAEGRLKRDGPAAALEVLSWLFELGDQDARRVAKGKGLEAGLALDDADAVTLERSRDDFTRGYVLAGRLLRSLERGDGQEEADVAALEVLTPILTRLSDQALLKELGGRVKNRGVERLRVGALLPLSGANRRVGARALSGLLVAQGVFRAPRGDELTLVLRDTASSPEGAAAAVDALVEAGVLMILGPLSNAEAAAAAAAAERHKVPIVSLNLNDDVVTAGPHVFRKFLNTQREVALLMDQARAKGARRIAVLYPEVSLGRESFALSRRAAERSGLKLVASESYPLSATDFRAIARRVRQAGAEAVFVADVPARVSLIMPHLASEGLWCGLNPGGPSSVSEGERSEIVCLGGSTWLEGELLVRTSSYVQGALIATGYNAAGQTRANQRFVQEYQSLHGRSPDLFAAYMYGAMALARAVLQKRGRGSVKEVLSSLRGEISGLSGGVVTSEGGNIEEPLMLFQVVGKKLVPQPSRGSE